MAVNKVEICGLDTSKLPMMTYERSTELLKKISEGDEEARDIFIKENLRLVLSVIQRFSGRGEQMDDLFQVGCIGLIKAINNFDLSFNVRFSTYAVPMIIGEVRRHLRDNNSLRVSRSIRDTAYHALQIRARLMDESGQEPHISDIAKAMDVKEEDVAFAPENLGVPSEEIRKRVDEALALVGMSEYAAHAPHLLSGGRVDNVVDALIAAHRANLDLSFERAAAIDLAGRNVFEAVKMSVTPKIIETPWISAVAIDGIEVKVIAKVTVRANLSRLVGGAGEETIIARVGEGIVTTVGSSQSHKSVLENPDLISRTVLSKGLDNGTAFEILSIDIADVDIGRNIGAHLQIQQAEADKQIAQAKAEERRATAIAKEQEMRAEVEHMKAKVVEAEAEVPRAMAEALRSGNLGVMDYYRMQNVQADTAMKNNVGNTDLSKVFHKEQCIETKDN